MSHFCANPCLKNGDTRVSNRDTNLVREPLTKPVKEEEGACASITDDFFEKLLAALGLDPDALPGWWQGWPPREHVQRWRDHLGLTEPEILEAAGASRQEHPEPPDGPKALDRALQRAAQRKAQHASTFDTSASTKRGNRRSSRNTPSGRPPSADETAAFYADLVNSDRFLPASTISNGMRDAMLIRGLVTVERLRERGIR